MPGTFIKNIKTILPHIWNALLFLLTLRFILKMVLGYGFTYDNAEDLIAVIFFVSLTLFFLAAFICGAIFKEKALKFTPHSLNIALVAFGIFYMLDTILYPEPVYYISSYREEIITGVAWTVFFLIALICGIKLKNKYLRFIFRYLSMPLLILISYLIYGTANRC